MVTITNQNVIVLGGFSAQAAGTNNVQCITICIILHDLFHVGNFSSIHRQPLSLTDNVNVVVNPLHQLCFGPITTQTLGHEDMLQITHSTLSVDIQVPSQLMQQPLNISQNTRGHMPPMTLQAGLTLQKF